MTDADLPPPPAAPPPPATGRPPAPAARRRHPVLTATLTAAGGLLLVAILVGFLVHLPYVVISPGEATPLDRNVVMIDGARTYPHAHPVLFLTVRVSNRDPNLWRLLAAWLDSDDDIQKRAEVEGCLTPAESTIENTLLMKQSQDDAKYVALTHVGYTVTADPPRTIVLQACPGTPAHGRLAVGDQVVSVDGHPISGAAELVTAVRSQHPGDTIAIGVVRDGNHRDTSVVAGRTTDHGLACSPVPAGSTPAGTACLGIAPADFVDYDFPIDVHIDTRQVGGPSAGLAFTLAIIDDLQPGSLTEGRRVAVTGTISPDGSVGAVGGVEQKAITARKNGVQLMLVPTAEVADAKKGADTMKVVGVKTVDDALRALAGPGGPAVPPASPAVARS
jgi:PDZ domain-containing protein